MSINKRYYKLFDCCKVVEGYNRCLIYDLQRLKYYAVPKYLNVLLKKIESHELGSAEFTEKDQEWIAYLLEKEILFVSDESMIKLFSASDNTFNYPAHISNTVIILKGEPAFSINLLRTRLEEAICRDIVFVFNDYLPSVEYLFEMFKAFEGSLIKTVDLFIPYSGQDVIKEYEAITDSYNRLSNIFIYNAPINSVHKSSEIELGNIFLQVSGLVDTQNISVVSLDHFSLNGDLYREALKYNTFYNRKVFIDQAGDVYNTSDMAHSFGTIDKNELKQIIAKDGFNYLWEVKKDDIVECRDCEYRYMCVDARIPVKNEKGAWEFRERCNYNPYESVWRTADSVTV